MQRSKYILFMALAVLTALSSFRCSSTGNNDSSSRGSLAAGIASGKF